MPKSKKKTKAAAEQAVVTSLVRELQTLSVAPKAAKPKRKKKGGGGSGALTTAMAPVAFSATTVGRGPQTIVHSGTDWVETSVISPKSVDGEVVLQLDLSPQGEMMAGTHLAQVARGFELYRYTNCSIKLVSRAPTSVGGGYLVGVTPEVGEALPDSGSAARHYVRSLPGSVSTNWWQSAVVKMPMAGAQQWYHVSASDQRYATTQGMMLLVVDGPPIGLTEGIRLSVQIDWTVRLGIPVSVSLSSSDPGDYFKKIPQGSIYTLTREAGDWPLTMFVSDAGGQAWLEAWNKSAYGQVYECHPPLEAKLGEFDLPATLQFLVAHKWKDTYPCFYAYTTEAGATADKLDFDWPANIPVGTSKKMKNSRTLVISHAGPVNR